MPTEQAAFAGGVARNGAAWLLGGWGCNSSPTELSWVYVPTANAWGSATSLPLRLSGAATGVLPNDSLLLAGGMTPGTLLFDVSRNTYRFDH